MYYYHVSLLCIIIMYYYYVSLLCIIPTALYICDYLIVRITKITDLKQQLLTLHWIVVSYELTIPYFYLRSSNIIFFHNVYK